jgi:crotonobetainyl-CoA:carnitine CoA-transferase CaiB-like acyl-CoA transferase
LQEAGIPAAVVNTIDRALSDPQVLHRGMITEVRDADGTTVRLLGNPVKLGRSANAEHRFPPHLGQDTWTVVSELLDLSDEEIAELSASGAVPETETHAR